MISTLKIVLVVQLFFALGITLLTHTLPLEARLHTSDFQPASEYDITEVSGEFQENLASQQDIPVIELGSLVFYSGNILLDLLVNFVFAIPQMVTLVINGVFSLFSMDAYILGQLQIFITALIAIIYVIGIIQTLVNIRSTRGVT
jgi:hypothetical protein